MKEPCMQEHLYKHFHTEGYKSFLGEASVTFIEGKKPKKKRKILDANIENNGTLWS